MVLRNEFPELLELCEWYSKLIQSNASTKELIPLTIMKYFFKFLHCLLIIPFSEVAKVTYFCF